MRFYHIEQYGRRITCQSDKAITKENEKEVCNRIVARAKRAAVKALMGTGAFDVIVCDEHGREIDRFISGTDIVY